MPMIAWINLAVLALSALLFLVFYLRSVRPAALEKEIGEAAYRRCARYRLISAVWVFVASGSYVVYALYPLPLGLPRSFPWPWWVSVLIAAAIAIPGGALFFLGLKDAGEETMVPRKEHALYGGIYDSVRHPQAMG
jgi:protein-S-isoprenylcysteine O-methyltransferase Ste14